MDDMILIHYGVKGQKWGVRNYQNPDGSYKPGAEGRYDPDSSVKSKIKSAYSKASSSVKRAAGSVSEKAKNFQLSDNAKTALKVGAVVAGTALAAYGTYKVAQLVKDREMQKITDSGQKYLDANLYMKVGEATYKGGRVDNYYSTKNEFDRGEAGHIFTPEEVDRRNNNTRMAVMDMAEDQVYSNKKLQAASKVVNAGDKIGSAVNKAGSAIGSAANKAGTKIGSAANKAGTKIGSAANKAATPVKMAAENVGAKVYDKAKYAKTFAGVAAERIGANKNKSSSRNSDQYEWKEVKVTQVPDFLKNGNNEVLNYNATYRTRVKKKQG